MKTKIYNKILAVICILVMILPICSDVLAESWNDTKGTTQIFGITQTHTSNKLNGNRGIDFGYQLGDNKFVYRIYREDGTSKDYSRTILCLDKDGKFPREDGSTNQGRYESQGTADSTTLPAANSKINADGVNKIKWLINNAVLPEDSAAIKDQKLGEIYKALIDKMASTQNPVTITEIKEVLTEDDIVFALQCALWKVTNNTDVNVIRGSIDGGKTYDGIYGMSESEAKGTYIFEMINYYITNFAKDSPQTPQTNTAEPGEAQFENLPIDDPYTVDGNWTFIGPFNIVSKDSTKEVEDFAIEIEFKNKEDKKINNVQYLLTDINSSTNLKVLEPNKKGLAEGRNNKFYIAIPNRYATIIKSAKVIVKTNYAVSSSVGTVWTTGNSTDQALLTIKRTETEPRTIDKEVTVNENPPSTQPDIALRKYIYSYKKAKTGEIVILSEGSNSREPQVEEVPATTPHTESKLKNPLLLDYDEQLLEATTADNGFNQYKYKHRKDPIVLEVGDEVTYRLMLRNESTIPAIVTKIVDYFPPYGLELVDSSAWTYNETDRAAYTQGVELELPDKGSTKYIDIKCKVTEEAKGRIVTNIAEIVSTRDSSNNELNDIDSETNNVELPSKNDDEAWQNYKGNEGRTQSGESEQNYKNKDELGDSDYYYKGQQDDDDFEKVKVLGEEGKYKIQIKKIDEENNTLGNAEFKVKYPDGEQTIKTAETGENKGIATTTDITVKEIGTDEIEITETKAPEGYKALDHTVKIKVDKVSSGGTISVNNPQIVGNEPNVTISKNNNIVTITIKNEKIEVEQEVYDLALKKYVSSVTSANGSNKEISADQIREIEVTNVDDLVNREKGGKADAKYKLRKTPPVDIADGDYVTYTIRVYNEGNKDAIAKEIRDTIPEGLEFVPYEVDKDGTYKSGSRTNYTYKWNKVEESQNEIRTRYLEDKNPIPKFDPTKASGTNKTLGLSYAEVKIEFKVNLSKLTEAKKQEVFQNGIKNIAEITEDDGDDNDSVPDNKKPEEDDEDYDVIIPKEFDLALRKFITKIDNTDVTDRVPEVKYQNGKISYQHTKEPKIVVEGQKVVYTLRVYNEGTLDGYASEITDDLPTGITFLPNDEVNKEYEWKMYDANGIETDDVKKATKIKTAYLSSAKSKSNLLKAFDSTKPISDTNPDYKEVKVAFEVTQNSATADSKVIINTAQISKDEDKDGNEVEDRDSTPDNNKPDEDDIDKEYLILKYFDLSLLKYISKVIVTEDGVTKEIETGYDGTENPEPTVKVEIKKNKLNVTDIKYLYSIKITNQGEIAGYATEITDRIPAGLAFYEEDNTEYGWKIKSAGIVTTDYLKGTLIEPGESKLVQIVLRWERSETNLGVKTNVAEISADDNEYDLPDIDSTPDNNKDGEDDQDNASTIVSIETGTEPKNIILVMIIITIIAGGCYQIYEKVIRG